MLLARSLRSVLREGLSRAFIVTEARRWRTGAYRRRTPPHEYNTSTPSTRISTPPARHRRKCSTRDNVSLSPTASRRYVHLDAIEATPSQERRTRDDAHSTEQNRCARPSDTTVRAVGRLQAAQGFSSGDILTCFIAAPRSASARSFASMARHSSADVAFSRSLASAIISAWSWRSLRDWRSSSIVLPPTRPDAQERPAALYVFFAFCSA